MTDHAQALAEALREALDAWDTHNKYGDPMQGHWARDARAALAAYDAAPAPVVSVKKDGDMFVVSHGDELTQGQTLGIALERLGPDELRKAPAPSDAHPDDLAVDRFAAAMKAKLAKARAKGRAGWDDPAICSEAELAGMLLSHVGKKNAGTFEDIANFCMMLHQRGADPSILAPAPSDAFSDGMRRAAEILRPAWFPTDYNYAEAKRAILAAIPATGAWEPPADQKPGEYTLAPHLQKLIENVIRQDGRMSKALRQQLVAYVSPAPAGEGEG